MALQGTAESRIDDYIVADLIQARLPVRVVMKPASGTAAAMHRLLGANRIQLYLGYDGAELTGPLQHAFTSRMRADPTQVAAYVAQAERTRFHVWASPSLGYAGGYTLAVPQATAARDHLQTVSDAARFAPGWTLAVDTAFTGAIAGWTSAYGLHPASVRKMSATQIYQALAAGRVQAALLRATDGHLKQLHLTALRRDKSYLPPAHRIVLANDNVAASLGLQQQLKPLWGAVSAADQMEMNYEATVLHRAPQAIARDFLVKNGLLAH